MYRNYHKGIVLEMLDLEYNEENLNMVDTLPPSEVFEHVVHYEGLLGMYPKMIKQWVSDIYGIDLDENTYTDDETGMSFRFR